MGEEQDDNAIVGAVRSEGTITNHPLNTNQDEHLSRCRRICPGSTNEHMSDARRW